MKVSYFFKKLGIFFIGVVMSACQKNQLVVSPNPNDLNQTFIQFWSKMNFNYVFWDKDQTNWDSIYTEYKPRFESLTNSDLDQRLALLYFRQICSHMIDNHLLLTFNEGVLRNSVINPAYDRKSKKSAFHEKLDYSDLVKQYLDNGSVSGRGDKLENGVALTAQAGTINESTLYFNCNFFSLKKAYSGSSPAIKNVLTYFFNHLKSGNMKSVILDLRNNSGGDIDDFSFLAGKLVDRDITFGFTRSSSGILRNSYTPWISSTLKHDNDFKVIVPVIILVNNYTASLSEIMIIALRSKKNLIVGERTYGATGAVSDSEIFNSGPFDIGTFLSVKTSSVEFIDINGISYEDIGIAPDLSFPFDTDALKSGRDTQLESAIKIAK